MRCLCIVCCALWFGAVLAQCEHELGRFLKANSEADKSRAGRMMLASGRAFCASSQSRVTLRVPLERLSAEVETFRVRVAISAIRHLHATRSTSQSPSFSFPLSWLQVPSKLHSSWRFFCFLSLPFCTDTYSYIYVRIHYSLLRVEH